MDKATPRGMIRGLLKVSEGIDESKIRTQGSNFQQTSSLTTVSTPRNLRSSESVVLRSSGLKRFAQRSLVRKTKKIKSFPTPSEIITPRTTIKTLLKEANKETPVEIPTKPTDKTNSEILLQKKCFQPTSSGRNVEELLLGSSSRSTSSKKPSSRKSVLRRSSAGRNLSVSSARETITPRDNIKTFLRAAETEVATKMQETPVNENSIISELEQSERELFATEELSTIVQDEPQACEAPTDEADETEKDIDGEIAIPFQHEDMYKMSDVMSDSNQSTRDSVKWSNLHTPVLSEETISKASPVVIGKPPLLLQNQQKSRKVSAKRSQVERKNKDVRLPLSLVKGIFSHFSVLKVSKDAFDVIESGSDAFFQHLSSDLMSYCKHAKRKTIEQADVELLLRRQGLVTSKESFHALIEKYLPMEYRQEIIPSAKDGNKVVPKQK